MRLSHTRPVAAARIHGKTAAIGTGDISLPAERIRGAVMSHREWLETDRARRRIRQQWSTFFREWDVVVCPAASVPAFRHDHSSPIEARRRVDGGEYPYYDACFGWADPASSCGLPATAAPIDRSPTGLPIGVRIVGPTSRIARRSPSPHSLNESSADSQHLPIKRDPYLVFVGRTIRRSSLKISVPGAVNGDGASCVSRYVGLDGIRRIPRVSKWTGPGR
jgi:hypothetical protein